MNTSPPPNVRSSLDRFSTSFAEKMIKFRWIVIALALILTIAIASNARFLTFGNDYRVFFSDENPELTAFEDLQNTYTKNDNLFFSIKPKDGGDVFRTDVMAAVADLTDAGWQLPYSTRVDSVTNFQHTYAIEDDLIVEDLIGDPLTMSDADFDARRTVAIAEPLIRNLLLTADGSATAVNVVLQYPYLDPNEIFDVAEAARTLRERIRTKYPTIEVHLSGVSMLNHAFSESGQRDFSSLVPAMFLLVLLLTTVTLRSITATLSTMLVIILSIMLSMGVAGIARIALTPISMSSMIVILTLAVADSIHILLAMRGNMQRGASKIDALIEAVRVNFLAIAITSLTTVIGFLALNFSDSPPFKHLGNMAAVGIGAAWLFSITLLPALISLMPIRIKAIDGAAAGGRLMGKLGEHVVGHYRAYAAAGAVFAVTVIMQIPRIEFNDAWTEYFSPTLNFRVETDVVTQDFGLYPVEFSVPSGEVGGIAEPDYLTRLEGFTNFLRDQDAVVHVYALSDVMKRLNRNMNADNDAYYRLPGDRELSAQYLLLYELSLPYGLDLNDRINIDKSASRVTATLGSVTTAQTKEFLAAARKYISENFPENQQAVPTSAQVMFTYITDRNVEQMIRGTIVAIIAISLIMILALRNIRLGILSLIPNAIPILTAFGIWAVFIGQVGFSIAIVAAISLGIVVDDTVHMMTKYLRARREHKLSPKDAIVFAFSNVGLAIFVNTVILTIGFSLLTMSTFKVTQDMGLLTMLSISFALIFDFFLLPALLIWTDRVSFTSTAKGTS